MIRWPLVSKLRDTISAVCPKSVWRHSPDSMSKILSSDSGMGDSVGAHSPPARGAEAEIAWLKTFCLNKGRVQVT